MDLEQECQLKPGEPFFQTEEKKAEKSYLRSFGRDCWVI